MLRSWLKRRREELGISQEELAKLVQLKRQSIGQYENYQREVSIDLLRKLTIPLKFSLRIAKGEIIIMEKQQLEHLEELKIFQAWRNEFYSYLKKQPSLTIKILEEAGIQLAEKHGLKVLNSNEEHRKFLTFDIFRDLIYSPITTQDLSKNFEKGWADLFLLTNSETKDREDSWYCYEKVNRVINNQLKSTEAVHFKFNVDLSLIEAHRKQWTSKGIGKLELKEIFSELPIKVTSTSSVFYVSEKQEIKKEH